jgi:hypothetical protein
MNKQDKQVMRNLKPHKEAVIAMWLFGEEYSRLGIGAIDYYDQLPGSKKRLCACMLEDINNAQRKEEA